jgi:hypothetical protein
VKSARVERIREAIAMDSDDAIAAAAMPNPEDVLVELDDQERARVQAALQAAKPFAGRKSFMFDPTDSKPVTPVEPDESDESTFGFTPG